MLVFTMNDLLLLADAYCDATGIELTSLGHKVNENHRLFTRLSVGYGCSAKGAEAATEFFLAHWPPDVPWPRTVPDLRSAMWEMAEAS